MTTNTEDKQHIYLPTNTGYLAAKGHGKYVSLVIAGAAIIIYIAVSTIALVTLTGGDADAMQGEMAIYATIITGLITIIYSLIARHYLNGYINSWWKDKGFTRHNPAITRPLPMAAIGRIGLVILCAFIAAQIIAGVAYHVAGSKNFDAVNDTMASVPPAVLLPLVFIVAPVSEELLMRGLIYPVLRSYWSVWTAGIITGLIFGLVHGNLIQFIVTIPLTIIVIWVYELSFNIGYCVLIHMLFNFAAVVLPLMSLTKDANPAAMTVIAIVFAAAAVKLATWSTKPIYQSLAATKDK